MGADLHIGSFNNSQGYFRDSYNDSSVLWQLDLSWWQDVIPLCDEEGFIKGEKLTEFRGMIAARDLPSLDNFRSPYANDCNVAGTHLAFTRKRQALLEFIDRALSLNLPIEASL